jgi:hypothetical protein
MRRQRLADGHGMAAASWGPQRRTPRQAMLVVRRGLLIGIWIVVQAAIQRNCLFSPGRASLCVGVTPPWNYQMAHAILRA